MPRGSVCPSCLQPLERGNCKTTWCENFVSTGRAPRVQHGNTGHMRVPTGGTLSGGTARKPRVPSDVNTGLVADRGPQKKDPDVPGIARARRRAARHSAKSKPARLARDKKKARREANRAIGKQISEASWNADDGVMETIEGTMIEERRGLLGGKKYIVVKDPTSDIWEDD